MWHSNNESYLSLSLSSLCAAGTSTQQQNLFSSLYSCSKFCSKDYSVLECDFYFDVRLMPKKTKKKQETNGKILRHKG